MPTEAQRLESAAFRLRTAHEKRTGYTYGMEDSSHADDELVQEFRAVWRVARRIGALGEQEPNA